MSSATTYDAATKAIDYAANLVSISRTSADTLIVAANTHFTVGQKDEAATTNDYATAGPVDKTGGNNSDTYAIKIAQTLPAVSDNTSGVTISFPWTNTGPADYQYYFDSSSANREVFAGDDTVTANAPEAACANARAQNMTAASWNTGSTITATPSSSTSVLGTVAFDPTTASWNDGDGTTGVGEGVCFQISASSASNAYVSNPKVMSN